jgi:hypothetical protein
VYIIILYSNLESQTEIKVEDYRTAELLEYDKGPEYY